MVVFKMVGGCVVRVILLESLLDDGATPAIRFVRLGPKERFDLGPSFLDGEDRSGKDRQELTTCTHQ